MKVAKLLDDSGRPIREPIAVPGSVSFDFSRMLIPSK